MKSPRHPTPPTHRPLMSYTVGFLSSIILTLVAYGCVVNHTLSGWSLAYALAGLATVQCVIQLYLFLHLGQESRPRWKLLTMLFMLSILIIVVFGSLWVMQSLNTRMMMTPEQMTKYMQDQTGL